MVGEPTPSPSQEGIFRPYGKEYNLPSIFLITVNPEDPLILKFLAPCF
jgi:hypothetical protein